MSKPFWLKPFWLKILALQNHLSVRVGWKNRPLHGPTSWQGNNMWTKIRLLCVGEGPRFYEAKLLNSSLIQMEFIWFVVAANYFYTGVPWMCAHVYCRDELGQTMMPRGWQCKGVFRLPHSRLTLLDWETDATGLGRVYVSVFIAHCGLLWRRYKLTDR